MSPSTHEEYFEGASPKARHLLHAIQKKVEELLPNASRCISYKMGSVEFQVGCRA